MRESLRLGRVAGIPIGLHWSIGLIAAFLTFTLAGTVLPAVAPGYAGSAYLGVALVMAVVFLAGIVAHELGHSLVALRNGVGVDGITLFALGGVAKLDREPPTPRAAAHIALAGPAVSVAIGVGALLAAGASSLLGLSGLFVAGLAWLGLINFGLALFNMLPALPLDGGRALQAWLWHRKGNRDQATVSAASVGRRVGWVIVAFGLWQFFTSGAGLFTAFIGWFVVGAAKAEGLAAKMRLRLAQRPAPVFFSHPYGGTVIDVEAREV